MRTICLGALCLGLVACADHPLQPMLDRPAGPSFSAAPATTATWLPYKGKIYNSCVPEWIDFDGGAHLLSHATNRPGRYQIVVSSQFNVAGVGLSTGDRYRVSGLYNEVINYLGNDYGPYEDHLVQARRLVRESTGTTYAFNNVWQLTVNANGEVAVFLDKWWISGC